MRRRGRARGELYRRARVARTHALRVRVAERGMRAIALNLPGYGASSKTIGGWQGKAGFLRRVAEGGSRQEAVRRIRFELGGDRLERRRNALQSTSGHPLGAQAGGPGASQAVVWPARGRLSSCS